MIEIWELIKAEISFPLILLIIAVGELSKKLKITYKSTFHTILILSLIVGSIYVYVSKIEIKVAILSYLVANWLYPFIVKIVINKINPLKK